MDSEIQYGGVLMYQCVHCWWILENEFDLMAHLVDGSCLALEFPSDLAHVVEPSQIDNFFQPDAGQFVPATNDLVPAANDPVLAAHDVALAINDLVSTVNDLVPDTNDLVSTANDLVPATNHPVSTTNDLVLPANDPVIAKHDLVVAQAPAPASKSAPELVPTPRQTFKCMLCNEIFPDPNDLYAHFKDKACFSPHSHQYTELREQYDIPQPSKYSATAMLQVALWEDLSVNPKQCPCCAKTFATSAATSNHVRALRGTCKRQAEKKKSLQQEAKRWKCREEDCSAETEGRRAMVEHLEKEHGDVRTVRCVYCGWLFKTERHLACHEELEEGCIW